MATEKNTFPAIRSGGSLIIAWQAKEKLVLIVGGGNIAAQRIVSVLEADAKVTLVCPESGLNDEVKYRIQHNQVEKWVNREFQEIDLNGVDLVLTAIDDPVKSREIWELSRARKIPVNVADVSPLCDFYFMSQHREGPLQVAVSTNGNGPKLANIIRRHIGETLPEGTGEAITKVGQLRQKIRKIDPAPSSSNKRMNWMSRICEDWSIDELKQLDEKTIDALLAFYESDQVPKCSSIVQKEVFSKKRNGGHEKSQDIQAAVQEHKSDPRDDKETITEAGNQQDESRSGKKGRMILLGAGPGDPSLLTHKATTLLASADLVLSDRLVSPDILSLASCEIRLAPHKLGGKSRESQDQLLTWGLEALREGKTVIRLKSGDPFLFARGGEEVTFFREHGWDAEVVPGISSALAAPMAANVPVTHRGVADQVLITTGQGTHERMPEIPIYHKTRTIVILMAVGKAHEWSKLLSNKGYPENLPAMFVENSNRKNERIIRATVATLGQAVDTYKVVSPSVLVIGWTIGVLNKDNPENLLNVI